MSGYRKWSEIKRDRAESQEWDRLLKCAARLPVMHLLDYIDTAGSGMAKAVQSYRGTPDMFSLLEIRRGLNELQAVTEELIMRQEAAEE